MTATLPGIGAYERQGAEFDDDRTYRYSLHRMWGGGSLSAWKTVLWVMLNPSTADESVLDPTLRRVEGFTRAWGYDGFEVCNLFAYRATDPDDLPKLSLCGVDIVGGVRTNDALLAAADRADLVVCGWGKHTIAQNRARTVTSSLRGFHQQIHCLGTNADGSPRHPLYLSKSTQLQEYRG